MPRFDSPAQSSNAEPAVEAVSTNDGAGLQVRVENPTSAGNAIEVVDASGRVIYAVNKQGAESPAAPAITARPKAVQETVVTGFQPGHGFFLSGPGALNIGDTSSFVNGAQCIKVTTDGAGGITIVKKNTITPTIDMTGKFLRLWVRVPSLNDLVNIGGIAVYVSSDNNVANYGVKEFGNVGTPNQRHFIAADNDWTGITLSWGELAITGAPSRAAINSIWLRVWDQNGAAINVQFGGIELVPEPVRATISVTFDDGRDSQYTEGRKKLSQYRYPATAYIIRDLVGTSGFMTLGQIQALSDLHGWEIAAHADTVANHNLASGFAALTDAQLESEMSGIKTWLRDNGFGGGAHLALPKGEHNSTVYKHARRHFQSTRSTYSLSRETWPPADYNKLRIFNTDNTTTFAAVQTAITRAVANKEWLILLFHEIVSAPSTSTQMSITTFGQIVDEIATQGISVRTVGDVVQNGVF